MNLVVRVFRDEKVIWSDDALVHIAPTVTCEQIVESLLNALSSANAAAAVAAGMSQGLAPESD